MIQILQKMEGYVFNIKKDFSFAKVMYKLILCTKARGMHSTKISCSRENFKR